MPEKEYPSNRNREKTQPARAEQPKRELPKPVVTGEVVRRKRPWTSRFVETFLGGDTKSVGSYIMFDVALPAAKDMLADIVTQGVERSLFGDVRSTGRRPGLRFGGGSSHHTPYNRFSSSPLSRREEPRGPTTVRARTMHNFDDVFVPSRAEAEEVLEGLTDLIRQYENATVADLYGMLNVTPAYTDQNWGWYDLAGADIRRERHGYLIKLPRPEPLD